MFHVIDNLSISSTILEKAQSGNTLIFTDNAVLALKQEYYEVEPLAKKAFSHINLFARKADFLIRSISTTELLCEISIIDDEWQYKNVISQEPALKSYS